MLLLSVTAMDLFERNTCLKPPYSKRNVNLMYCDTVQIKMKSFWEFKRKTHTILSIIITNLRASGDAVARVSVYL